MAFSFCEFFTKDEIARKVNKPVDKTEWGMTPQTINAYYNQIGRAHV